MTADESSPILPVLDQLREHPQLVPEEVLGLLERLAEIRAACATPWPWCSR